jgi:hypothetical protein
MIVPVQRVSLLFGKDVFLGHERIEDNRQQFSKLISGRVA